MISARIKKLLMTTVAALTLASVTPGPAAGQQCLPADAVLENLYLFSVQLATGEGEPWAETRTTHDIPQRGEGDVLIVSDDATCRDAGREYKKEFKLQGPAPDVHVVRIGPRYIVLDPATKRGEFELHLVLDLSFNVISSWAG